MSNVNVKNSSLVLTLLLNLSSNKSNKSSAGATFTSVKHLLRARPKSVSVLFAWQERYASFVSKCNITLKIRGIV